VRPVESVRYAFEGREGDLGDYMVRANANGLMVLSGGRVVFAGFAGPATWSRHLAGPAGVYFRHCCLQARLQDFATSRSSTSTS